MISVDNPSRKCDIWSVALEESESCELGRSGKVRSPISQFSMDDDRRAQLRERYVMSATKLQHWKECLLSLDDCEGGKTPDENSEMQMSSCMQFLLTQTLEMQWVNDQIEQFLEAQSKLDCSDIEISDKTPVLVLPGRKQCNSHSVGRASRDGVRSVSQSVPEGGLSPSALKSLKTPPHISTMDTNRVLQSTLHRSLEDLRFRQHQVSWMYCAHTLPPFI